MSKEVTSEAFEAVCKRVDALEAVGRCDTKLLHYGICGLPMPCRLHGRRVDPEETTKAGDPDSPLATAPAASEADDQSWRTFGRDFRQLKSDLGFTMGDIARRFGISVTLVSAMEHGKQCEPARVDMERLASVLMETLDRDDWPMAWEEWQEVVGRALAELEGK